MKAHPHKRRSKLNEEEEEKGWFEGSVEETERERDSLQRESLKSMRTRVQKTVPLTQSLWFTAILQQNHIRDYCPCHSQPTAFYAIHLKQLSH